MGRIRFLSLPIDIITKVAIKGIEPFSVDGIILILRGILFEKMGGAKILWVMIRIEIVFGFIFHQLLDSSASFFSELHWLDCRFDMLNGFWLGDLWLFGMCLLVKKSGGRSDCEMRLKIGLWWWRFNCDWLAERDGIECHEGHFLFAEIHEICEWFGDRKSKMNWINRINTN